jgi:hypothetical protein
MRAAKVLALLSAAWLGAAAPAGPELATWAKPYAGRWTLSGVSEGDPVCGLTLGQEMVIGGASIAVSATCRRNYPLEDVAGWALSGRSPSLIDPLRKALLRFDRAGDGSFTATFADGRTVSLERGPPDRPASWKAVVDDEGTFTLSGPNNAGACGFSLTAASATSGRLEQAGRCAAPWKGRGWSRWSLQGQALSLLDRQGRPILVLKRADDYSFEATRDGAPVFFGPGVIDGSEMLERAPR